jgi:hypothetical protein
VGFAVGYSVSRVLSRKIWKQPSVTGEAENFKEAAVK